MTINAVWIVYWEGKLTSYLAELPPARENYCYTVTGGLTSDIVIAAESVAIAVVVVNNAFVVNLGLDVLVIFSVLILSALSPYAILLLPVTLGAVVVGV